MGNFGDIVARMGTVKNPVLFSSGTFSVAIMFFSKDLMLAPHLVPIITGAVMFMLSVLVFLVGLGFYIYAFLRLPGTTQELVFLQEAKAAVDRHDRTVKKARVRKPTGNA
jgi:hypothetical protein